MMKLKTKRILRYNFNMLIRSILTIILIILATLGPIREPVYASQDSQVNSPGSRAICLPGVYLDDPGDCLPVGPSAYLTQLATHGLILPIKPLAATPIDTSLGNVNVRYAEVRNSQAPVFGSVEDAVEYKRKNAVRTLDGETVYISYTNEQEVGGKKLYQIDFNSWMTGNDLSRIGALPRSQGLEFQQTPANAFGWVLTYFSPTVQIETKRTPGFEQEDYTGRLLSLYDLVQIYSEEQVDDMGWIMIGPDEWIPQKYVAKVIPNTVPPPDVSNGRWIDINLYEQTLAVYENKQLVFATIIASGADPFWTRPGLFQIYSKIDTAPMSGSFEADNSDAYYLEDVPWTMYFDEARALHGAYWRAKMGYPQSHGCVNLAVGDAHWLYDWALEGDWVYVWDPTGQTPTDPNVYGSGGF